MLEPSEPARAAALLTLFGLYGARAESHWVEATGSSMLPSIPEGTWLLVDFGAREPRVGEIALFSQANRILAHRILAHRVLGNTETPGGRVLTTKGDSRSGVDPAVPAADVLGTVRCLRQGTTGTPRAATCKGRRAVTLARLSATAARIERRAQQLPLLLRLPILKLSRLSTRAAFRLAASPPKP